MAVFRLARPALLVLMLGLLAFSLIACISIGTPVPTATKPAPVPDTPTPIVIVVTATPAPSPTATNTAVPPPPTATATVAPPAPTATIPKTPVLPTPIPPPPPSPTPQCQELPVRGFGKVWFENTLVRDYVGCPSYPKTEEGTSWTGQRFEQGVIFFVGESDFFHKDAVFVLFRDNKTWSKVIVPQGASPAPIGDPPAGKYAPQGRIGVAWQQGAGVRTRLGWAVEPEKSGVEATPNNAAWQAFSRGYMYWLPWNLPDDRFIYVVATAKPYPPGGTRFDWLEYKDTFQ